MKRVLSTAAAIMVVGAMLTPAVAEDRPTPIAPPRRWVRKANFLRHSRVRRPRWGNRSAQVGAQKRMGDQGTLPATKGMSGATPQMNPPAAPAPAAK